MLSCLSVLSVMLVYCGQTIGQIKMKLGMQVGLSPGHTVLDGDTAVPTEMGTAAPHIQNLWAQALPASFLLRPSVHIMRGPCLLWPNGWMDQDAAWKLVWW